MSERTRNRINAAFDDELSAAPVPPSLRHLSVRAAIAAPRPRSRRPELLALVAAVLAIALVAAVFVDIGLRRNVPVQTHGSTIPPAPRANAVFTYDQAHGVMVFFSGTTNTAASSAGGTKPDRSTWTWDGKYWVQMHPAASPPARQGGAMAYDAAHRNVVLFGGNEVQTTVAGKGNSSAFAPVDDTWTWSGSQWQQRHPAHSPAFGFDFPTAMQYDPISKTVLLFGFTQSHTEAMTDIQAQTWSWNGSDWLQTNGTGQPPAIPGVMVSDGHRLLLIAQSRGQVSGRFLTQTWAWDGTTWNLLHPKLELPPTAWAAAAFDPGEGKVLLVSGEAWFADTWTWDGSTWARQHPAMEPLRPGYMAYVPSLHKVVSWGDRIQSDDNEMFAWDGTSWSILEAGTVVASGSTGNAPATVRATPEQAAATVRSTVKNTQPVLLPPSLPSGGPWDAFVQVTPDYFSITYESDLRDKTITICICAANPPPATGADASDKRVKFRNAAPLKYGPAGYADYLVYDTTAPTSQRYLDWLEPGSATNPVDYNGGVYYFLSATGLTDQEFWQIANSLR